MNSKQKTTLEKALLKAIETSGLSVYRISKDSGLDKAPLYNFVNGKRSLTLPTASKLADFLGLELLPKQKKKTVKKRK